MRRVLSCLAPVAASAVSLEAAQAFEVVLPEVAYPALVEPELPGPAREAPRWPRLSAGCGLGPPPPLPRPLAHPVSFPEPVAPRSDFEPRPWLLPRAARGEGTFWVRLAPTRAGLPPWCDAACARRLGRHD